MGEIIPFVARVRDVGDWTSAERAKLEALADRFAEAGVHVDVVYGVTDDGDPWCVVKDENEEILLHVARIGGAFVVHYAAEDSVAEAPDLPSALGERLTSLETATDDHGVDHVVVPFAAGGRQAQMLIALVVATAFFYDTREAHAEPGPQDHGLPEAEGVAAAAVAISADAPAPQKDRELVLHGAAAGEGADAPKTAAVAAAAEPAPAAAFEPEAPTPPAAASAAAPAPPEPEAAPAHAGPVEAEGQVLTGTSGADTIHGGAGDDTLSGGGAPLGQFDVLDGGAGDDRIVVTAQVVAIGGAGADTFVIEGPRHMGDAHQMLGVILDFRAEDGDRMIGHAGGAVTFVTSPDGVVSRLAPPALPPGVTAAELTQRFVDLNGDGRADGFLFVGHGPGHGPAEPPKEPPPEEPPAGAGEMPPGAVFVHELFG